MLTLESVFVTDAFPQHTYVAANEGKVEKLLRDGLEIKNKIVSIVGPSKCGKTTLCDKQFGTSLGVNKLLITGDNCDSTDAFWFELFKQSNTAEDGDDGYPSRSEIIERLVQLDIPVIIDDFHYIDREIQKKLCQQLKNAAAQGLRFIVLNTTQRGDDPVRNNQDLSGRFFSIDMNFWESGGLREIGVKGFQKLGVQIEDGVLDILVRECLGSPQLMQTLCLETGREYLNLDNAFEAQPIKTSNFEWGKVRERAIRSYDNSALYQKLKDGPSRRGQKRSTYKLVNGEEGDVYDVVTHALATNPPFSSLSLEELRARVDKVIKPNQHPNLPAALDQMNELLSNGGHKPLEYDEESRRINILDPHFYFFLRAKAIV